MNTNTNANLWSNHAFVQNSSRNDLSTINFFKWIIFTEYSQEENAVFLPELSANGGTDRGSLLGLRGDHKDWPSLWRHHLLPLQGLLQVTSPHFCFDKVARKAVLIKIHDIAFVPWHNVLLKKFVSIGSANSEIKIRQKKLMTQNRKVRTQAAFFKGESLWYSSKPESTSNVCKCCCRPCGLPDNAQYDRNTIRLLLEYL